MSNRANGCRRSSVYGTQLLAVIGCLLVSGCQHSRERTEPEHTGQIESAPVPMDPSPTERRSTDPNAALQDLLGSEDIVVDYHGFIRGGNKRDCKGSPNEELCRKGSVSFSLRCGGCHGSQGVQARKGPSLVDLVGRKRVFLSGQSIVADEGYIRRSVVDHSSDAEYVPGWKGTFYRVRAQTDVHSDWLAYARHREALSRKYNDANARSPMKPSEVEAIIAFVMALSPEPSARAKTTSELVGDDDLSEGQVRREIEMRLESIAQCYQIEIAKELQTPGKAPMGNVVELALNGLREPKHVVLSDNVGNEFVVDCAVDAIASVVGASPNLGLPSDEVKVVLRFQKVGVETKQSRWWLHLL